MKHLFKPNLATRRARRLIVSSLVAVGLTILFGALSLSSRARKHDDSSVKSSGSDSAAETRARVAEAYGKLPMIFQANAGQTDARVKFTAGGAGYSLFLTQTESVFVMSRRESESKESRWNESDSERASKAMRPVEQSVLRMKLVGANPDAAVTGMDEMVTKVSYFVGSDPSKWHAALPAFSRVRYSEIYPGIDLVYYGNQRQLEYDFVVTPGADCRHISLAFEGADKVEVEETSGDLLLHTSLGVLRQHQPQIYQEVNGARRMIPGRYVKRTGGQVGFTVASYDRDKTLVIDPTLAYSTFLGGSGATQGTLRGDNSNAMAVDGAGNVYVTGSTTSPDFPITPGSYQTTYPGSTCAYVTKLNPSGTALVYSTYLSGASAFGIAVDGSGNAYVTGAAVSPFPTTPGAYQPANQAGSLGNAFITKLNPSGTALAYSTYLGGTGASDPSRITGGDVGTGIAVDPSGNACVAGTTYSQDFPTSPGAFQTTNKANNALNRRTIFVTRLNSTGTALMYSTYLGGTALEGSSGVAVDASGNAYVTGDTDSTDFPTTPGAFRTTFPGFRSGIATKLNSTGTALAYSTYLGGTANGPTRPRAITIDASGNAYLAGQTQSSNYPTTFGSFSKSYCGGFSDAFVTKLSADGSALVYSTYLCGSNFAGGDNADDAFGIAVDSAGNAYVTGYTNSDTFPITPDAYQTKCAGVSDAFLTKIDPSGATLLYSTFLGGAQFDEGYAGVGVDNSGHAYVAGLTGSPEFPATPGAFQTNHHGGDDVFIAKFDFSATAPIDQLLNIATRLPVQTGDNVLIGGFIITGTQPKKVLIMGIGPSLAQFFSGSLADPTLELYQGNQLLQTNDNWIETRAEIEATGLHPSNDLESAIVRTLDPGSYTAILRGKGGATGIGVVQAYDLNQAAQSKFANIATRGFVDSGDNAMIGGFIIGPTGGTTTTVVMRAIGPSLANFGITGALQDPTLELHNGNGATIAFNDNWKDDANKSKVPQSLQPSDPRESVLYRILAPGNYTAVMRGSGNSTGIGLVEIYNVE
jgi:beta-propeller repeat-containing protein